MVIEAHINNGLKAHVCTLRLNGQIYYTVDVYDETEKMFLPEVKVFKPNERQIASKYAKDAIGA